MNAEPLAIEADLQPRKRGKLWKRIPWIPVFVIAGFLSMAVAAPVLTPYSYAQIDLTQQFLPPAFLKGGNPGHLLGTDSLGRDLLTRICYGARTSLIVALAVIGIAGVVGLIAGTVAGYVRGSATAMLDRLIDATLSFPVLLVAMLLVVSLGQGMGSVVIAISLVLWARFARVIRGEVLSLRDSDFVAQAKIIGCSTPRTIFRHILPNVFNTFMVLVSLQIGWIIVVESTLSFLGAGIPPPYPTWGRLVSDGRAYVGTYWWLSVIPGICITLFVLSLNLLGNWLRDYFDPKLRQIM